MSKSRTYAVLDVSPSAYREIRERLAALGRMSSLSPFVAQSPEHKEVGVGMVIDMHGIALRAKPEAAGLREVGFTPEEIAEVQAEMAEAFSKAVAKLIIRWAKRAASEVPVE